MFERSLDSKSSNKFSSPLLWVFVFFLAGGIVGLGGFTFIYGQGFSYMVDDPKACANCHIMQSVYDQWNHGTHKAVATCNDCHTPEFFLGKYIVKAINGWNHSVAFTIGNFPEPLRITGFNRKITNLQCLKCHSALVSSVMRFHGKEEMNCLTCHSGVGSAGKQLIIDLYAAEILRATGNDKIPQGNWNDVRVFLPVYQRRDAKRKSLFHIINRYRPNRIFPENLAQEAPKSVLPFRPKSFSCFIQVNQEPNSSFPQPESFLRFHSRQLRLAGKINRVGKDAC